MSLSFLSSSSSFLFCFLLPSRMYVDFHDMDERTGIDGRDKKVLKYGEKKGTRRDTAPFTLRTRCT